MASVLRDVGHVLIAAADALGGMPKPSTTDDPLSSSQPIEDAEDATSEEIQMRKEEDMEADTVHALVRPAQLAICGPLALLGEDRLNFVVKQYLNNPTPDALEEGWTILEQQMIGVDPRLASSLAEKSVIAGGYDRGSCIVVVRNRKIEVDLVRKLPNVIATCEDPYEPDTLLHVQLATVKDAKTAVLDDLKVTDSLRLKCKWRRTDTTSAPSTTSLRLSNLPVCIARDATLMDTLLAPFQPSSYGMMNTTDILVEFDSIETATGCASFVSNRALFGSKIVVHDC